MNINTHKNPKISGFTLLELMIVVAIIGIIAAIAYPSYTESVLKGKRAQARSALIELLQQEERYMTQRNCYLGFTTNSAGVASASTPSPATACGGVTASNVPFKTFAGENISNASHLLSASTCAGSTSGSTLSIANCVRVTATPIGADPKAGNLEMTSTGVKSCTGTASGTNPRLCWP
ncbi:type IV pilin protein [Comamonas fluminis]|uniref:type IV pilin protein n=1 Tax=Comamonas fluminis TaxID=2796366 RepID=UPI001C44BF2E|nr:type IV pilin protein [Comamonas fluminis]